jgi:hypothetical protein
MHADAIKRERKANTRKTPNRALDLLANSKSEGMNRTAPSNEIGPNHPARNPGIDPNANRL